MLTEEILLEAGYKSHPIPSYKAFCDGFYQKVVRNPGKKLYFIDLFQWNFQEKTSWSAEVHFYVEKHKSETTEPSHHFFEVYLNIESETLPEIEEFFHRIYERMGCVPDTHNND